VQATDPSGNVRTNTYEVTQTGATKNFSYDANGNLSGDGTKTYEWDAENRLLAVKQGGNPLASFTYDADGRRSTKTAGGVTTTYVYDGAQFLEERPNPSTTRRYVYGPRIDQALAQVVGGSATYNVADHLGSVVRATDSLSNPTFTREYDPWGNLLQGSTASGYAFTGREWDVETGLYYYRARYYDPKVGRFLSEDKTAEIKSRTRRYLYVSNRPTVLADARGLYECAPSAKPFAADIDFAMTALRVALDKQKDRCCLKWFEKHGMNPIAWITEGLPMPRVNVRQLGTIRGSRVLGHTEAPWDFLDLDSAMISDATIDDDRCKVPSVILHEFGHLAVARGDPIGDHFNENCKIGCIDPTSGLD
jgi:RHS repeat-associated protein